MYESMTAMKVNHVEIDPTKKTHGHNLKKKKANNAINTISVVHVHFILSRAPRKWYS